jgi:hypothetical protein
MVWWRDRHRGDQALEWKQDVLRVAVARGCREALALLATSNAWLYLRLLKFADQQEK